MLPDSLERTPIIFHVRFKNWSFLSFDVRNNASACYESFLITKDLPPEAMKRRVFLLLMGQPTRKDNVKFIFT